MSKSKRSEIFKVVAVSALCIGLLGTGFIGVNTLAMAAAADKTESIPITATSVNIPAASVTPVDYKTPAMTVYEAPNEWYTVSANALSPDKAAELGAQYIWEMFGESINGKTVEMFYSAQPSMTKAWWVGSVADSKAELENGEALFRFTIDAVSGERIDISQDLSKRFDALKDDPTIKSEDIHRLRARQTQAHSAGALQMQVTPEMLEEYTQIVEEYAQKHFSNSEITDVTFVGASPSLLGLCREANEYGDVVITSKYMMLAFSVADDTGRVATVTVLSEVKQLLDLSTQDNDVVPGFNYDALGLG